jgi:hypothetical protein
MNGFVLLAWAASAVAAYFIGKHKGRPIDGLILGILLAWIGVLIIACLRSHARPSAGYPQTTGQRLVPVQAPAQWLPDPMARHEFRWWDGARWTEHVSDRGVPSQESVNEVAR